MRHCLDLILGTNFGSKLHSHCIFDAAAGQRRSLTRAHCGGCMPPSSCRVAQRHSVCTPSSPSLRRAPCGSHVPLSSCRTVLRHMGSSGSSQQMSRAPCGGCSKRRSCRVVQRHTACTHSRQLQMEAPCGSSLPLSSCRTVLQQMRSSGSSQQMSRALCGGCFKRRSQQRQLEGSCSSKAPGKASPAGLSRTQTSFWGLPAPPGCRSLFHAGGNPVLLEVHTVPVMAPPCAQSFRLTMLARPLQLLSRSRRLLRAAGKAACSGPGWNRGQLLMLMSPPGLLGHQELVSCSRVLTWSGQDKQSLR